MDTGYFKNKRVWITGASKGIGRALAIELTSRGAKLALSARNKPELIELVAEIGEDKALAAPLDVTDKESNIKTINDIAAKLGGIDIAILNAGTAEYVDVSQFDSTIFERLMQTNFMSMVYGVEAVLPYLRQSAAPQIVALSSTAAYAGLPRSEAYGATKAAIKNMFEGLRISLIPENIAVSIVCPGFVKTPLTDKNDFPMPMRIEAKKAAAIIANGVAAKTEEIHFPKFFSLSYKFLSSLPSSWYTRLINKMVLNP
ncbi:MAG: SDR family NAD(P)-dependent oxidoreductase [Gammaproteobacteria bacterium]|nr:SDR family NAD(P)-dependent oxidoreductase [Gammaproteobacteria bacterium]